MEVVNIKKPFLQKNGYKDLIEWKSKPNHIYIGRNVVYVDGASASKWKNEFSAKVYGLDRCLELYEEHIRNSHLYNELEELKGKVLGCWCKPAKCHGDILIKLLEEKLKK